MDVMLSALSALVASPPMLLALIVGCAGGLAAGLAPGVSGRSALLIALPFVVSMPPLAATVLLVSLHASAQIAGTIPAALLGAPTSASEAATALDGYPLAMRGEGGRVIGTILASSALGGIGGAVMLLVLAPIGGQFILRFGTPEIAAFAAVGIFAIAAVSSSGLAIGIVLGAAGVLASTIGIDPMSGVARFTFGLPNLTEGLSTPAVVAGLIAVPELLRQYQPAQKRSAPSASIGATARGLIEPIRHGWLTLRAAAIGFVVGVLPGIGANVAVWLAYGHAARSSHPDVPFGEGAIEGIIAPETASGAKEGGAYIPTLLLGVPGSSGMAILLGAFAIIGIRVGPTMFTATPQLPATVGFSMILADLLALAICLLAAPLMVRLASLDRRLATAVSLCAAIAAAYLATPQPGTALQILVFGAIGVVLQSTHIARPPFLIGFIIGPILESALRRSSIIFGWRAFERPGVLIIITSVVLALLYIALRRRIPADLSRSLPQRSRVDRASRGPVAAFAGAFIVAAAVAATYVGGAGIVPIVASCAGLAAAAAAIVIALKIPADSSRERPRPDVWLAVTAATGLLLCIVVGPLALALPMVTLIANVQRRT